MRADRLLSVLLLLQARGRVTAAEVADELEISERTARRDLDALAVAGVPLYSRQGRNGGWELMGGSKTDLTGLTAPEARGAVPRGRTGCSCVPAGEHRRAQAVAGNARTDATRG